MYDLYCIPLGDELAIGELKREPKAVIVLCDSEAIRYVKERTCKDQLDGRDPCVFVCSLCEHITDHAEDERPRYCPSCGAKVIDKAVD